MTVLYEDRLVQVTATAVHIRGGSTYFLNQISSVHVATDSNFFARAVAVLFGVAGAVLLLFTVVSVLVNAVSGMGSANADAAIRGALSSLICVVPSGIFILAGALIWRFSRPKHWLVFAASSGQARAMWSESQPAVEGIRTAIIQAMSSR